MHRKVPTILAMLALAQLAAAQEADPEPVTTWSGEVTLDAPFLVPEGATLVVEAGTAVRSGSLVRDDAGAVTANLAWLRVEGTLLVEGTPEAPVRFFTNVTFAGVGSSSSVIRGAVFDAADFPRAGYPYGGTNCGVYIGDASPRIESSRLVNMTWPVCVHGGTPTIAENEFLYNAFNEGLFPRDHCETDCPPAAHWEGAPGEPDRCWGTWQGGELCRGSGGAAGAISVVGGNPTIEGNRFEASFNGVFVTSGASATVRGNRFVDLEEGGVVVDAQGAGDRLVVIEGNVFTGIVERHPPADGLGMSSPAAVRVGARPMDATPGAQPERTGVVVRGNLFEGNHAGLALGGDARDVLVAENRFLNNSVGLVNEFGYAEVRDSVFGNRVWDLWLWGGIGHVRLVNVTFDPEKVKVEGDATVEWEGGVIRAATLAVAAASALALALAALTEAGRWVVTKGAVAVGFTRLARSRLLEHGTRERLHARIAADPGVHLRALAREAGSYGAAVYHLSRLEREGLVRSARDGARRRFYPAGAAPPSADLAPLARRLLALVEARPGVGVKEAARALGVSKQLASYHARALAERGLLVSEDAPGGGRALRVAAARRLDPRVD